MQHQEDTVWAILCYFLIVALVAIVVSLPHASMKKPLTPVCDCGMICIGSFHCGSGKCPHGAH